MTNSNLMVVLSSLQVAGKTTFDKKKFSKNFRILKYLSLIQLEKRDQMKFDGIDYFFVEKDEFQKKIENKDFYEYAKSLTIITEHQKNQ